jgi:FixJ family two-component response regulator
MSGPTLTLEQAAREAQLGGPPTRDQVSPSTGRRPGLTPREREVLRLVAEGATNQEIAAHLIIGEITHREAPPGQCFREARRFLPYRGSYRRDALRSHLTVRSPGDPVVCLSRACVRGRINGAAGR